MIIAVDGPAASGKSTISRILANKLGFYYLSSGLIYRTITYALVNYYGYTLETITSLRDDDIIQCVDPARLSYNYHECYESIFFEGKNITPYLKTESIDHLVPFVSNNRKVREAVIAIQHNIAKYHDVVVEGRDVGSVVFPYAMIKFFITASVDVRAERWRKDQERYGHYFSIDEAIALITERDERDKNRQNAPLIIPQAAIIIDTSHLTIEEAVEKMLYHFSVYSQGEIC